MRFSRILILDRNKLHLRKITRVLTCTGAELIPMEDKSEVDRNLDGPPALLCADAQEIATVRRVLKARGDMKAVVWTGNKTDSLLMEAHEHPRLSNLIGRPQDGPPRPWELLWTIRRLLSDDIPGIASLLAWGYTGFKERVRTNAERDAVVEGVVKFCHKFNTTSRVQEMFGELAHELLMNAMFDAPVDAKGKHKYAADRTAKIELEPDEEVTIRCATDGVRLLVAVTDHFGGLPRGKVFSGIHRGLQGGKMDTSHGGAGLGMLYIYRSSAIAIFDIVPGKRTHVVGIYELDSNQREFRSLPRSVHCFVADG